MIHAIQLLYDSPPLPLVLTVDSLGIYSTITTLHEGKDYRLRQQSLDYGIIRSGGDSDYTMIAGDSNIADALTKRNTAMYRILKSHLSQRALSKLP